MLCPTCNQKLIEFDYKSIKLDICPKCNSLWFDKDELRQAKDVKDEFLKWMDPDLWRDKTKFKISPSGRTCPRDSVPLYETTYNGSDIKIDLCTICEGIWLDKGEFDKIIDYLRKELAEKTISDYFKAIGEEGLEIFAGKEGFSSEVGDLLMVIKLLTYRIGAQFPLLKEIIRQIPK